MKLEFSGKIWVWRSPAPWYFVTVPLEQCRTLKAIVQSVTYGWHTPEPPAWRPYKGSKAAKNRLVATLGYHLKEKGIPVIAIAPGWMRTELMLTHHTMAELKGQTETPHYAARGAVALAGDPDALRHTGKVMDVGNLAALYGFTDLDGTQPHLNAGRYLSAE